MKLALILSGIACLLAIAPTVAELAGGPRLNHAATAPAPSVARHEAAAVSPTAGRGLAVEQLAWSGSRR